METVMGHGPECLCETSGCMGSTPEGRLKIERLSLERALQALVDEGNEIGVQQARRAIEYLDKITA